MVLQRSQKKGREKNEGKGEEYDSYTSHYCRCVRDFVPASPPPSTSGGGGVPYTHCIRGVNCEFYTGLHWFCSGERFLSFDEFVFRFSQKFSLSAFSLSRFAGLQRVGDLNNQVPRVKGASYGKSDFIIFCRSAELGISWA